jgi:hypothetical protein
MVRHWPKAMKQDGVPPDTMDKRISVLAANHERSDMPRTSTARLRKGHTKHTKNSRQRRLVRFRFAAKNAPAGQRQIKTVSVKESM